MTVPGVKDRTPASGARALPSDALVRTLIADELDCIRRALEEMGVQLCADPAVVCSHLIALQRIDELCQRHENLARILRAEDVATEAAGVTLESLRLRLQPALARQACDQNGAATGR